MSGLILVAGAGIVIFVVMFILTTGPHSRQPSQTWEDIERDHLKHQRNQARLAERLQRRQAAYEADLERMKQETHERQQRRDNEKWGWRDNGWVWDQ